jgi:hypothetical protein
LIAVVWAALVLVRTAATGSEFNGGAYGNGQKFAVVLAILVLVVGIRELLTSRRFGA